MQKYRKLFRISPSPLCQEKESKRIVSLPFYLHMKRYSLFHHQIKKENGEKKRKQKRRKKQKKKNGREQLVNFTLILRQLLPPSPPHSSSSYLLWTSLHKYPHPLCISRLLFFLQNVVILCIEPRDPNIVSIAFPRPPTTQSRAFYVSIR